MRWTPVERLNAAARQGGRGEERPRGRVGAGAAPPRPHMGRVVSGGLPLFAPSGCWLAIGGPGAGPPNPLKGGAVQPLPPPPPQSRRCRATAPFGKKTL